jgi:hypothetical protein
MGSGEAACDRGRWLLTSPSVSVRRRLGVDILRWRSAVPIIVRVSATTAFNVSWGGGKDERR